MNRAIRYSMLAFLLLACAFFATNTNAQEASSENFSFPWKEGQLWRFSGGTHNRSGGEFNYVRPWSGLDFVPTAFDGEKNIVRAVAGGRIFSMQQDCYVVIEHEEDNIYTRYLHMVSISVTKETIVSQGQGIGFISQNSTDTCYLTDKDGPHLHLDYMVKGNQGLASSYANFAGHYLGGYLVEDSTETNSDGEEIGVYDGPLSRDGIVLEPQSGGKIYLKNDGWIGPGSFDNPATKVISITKDAVSGVDSVVLCAANSACQRIYATGEHNVKIVEPMLSKLKIVMPTQSRHIDFIGKNEATGLTACVDFDVRDLSVYVFPGSTLSINDNSEIAYVRNGKCTAQKADFTKAQYDAGFLQPKDYQDCWKQRDGVYFTNDEGYCLFGYGSFHGPYAFSMPFTPNRITVLGSTGSHIQLYGKNGTCQAFNVKGNSTLPLNLEIETPARRVEVFYNQITPNDCSSVYNSGGWPDFPALAYYSRTGPTILEQPLLIWFVTAKEMNIPINIDFYQMDSQGFPAQGGLSFTNAAETEMVFAPWTVSAGPQAIGMVVKLADGGEILSGVLYEIAANPPPPYVGFTPQIQKVIDQFQDIFEFEVQSDQKAFVTGEQFEINGVRYGNALGKHAFGTLEQSSKIVYEIPPGTYVISNWSKGDLIVGTDEYNGYLDHLVLEKESLTGDDWEGIKLKDIPTPTPTATNTPAPTSTRQPGAWGWQDSIVLLEDVGINPVVCENSTICLSWSMYTQSPNRPIKMQAICNLDGAYLDGSTEKYGLKTGVTYEQVTAFTARPCQAPTATMTSTPTDTPSATSTLTPMSTSTSTPTASNTPASTPTAPATNIPSPTPTSTSTPTSTPTATETATPTHTPTWTQTPTSVPTETSTSTSTPTLAPMPSNTFTPTATETPNVTRVPTDTAVPTIEATVALTLTPTPTNMPIIMATSTPTSTPLPTPVVVIESERIYLPLIMR